MTLRRCIECNVRIDTDTCDCCGRYNDPVINGEEPAPKIGDVQVGDRIPAGNMGGIPWVLVVTKIIDQYRYEGVLEPKQ